MPPRLAKGSSNWTRERFVRAQIVCCTVDMLLVGSFAPISLTQSIQSSLMVVDMETVFTEGVDV